MAKKKKPDLPKDSSKAYAALSAVTGIVAATVTKKALNGGWKVATGKEPPANPADPDVALREAVVWAMVSGTTIALVRMLIARRTAGYYVKSVGHLPPELEADDVREARKQKALAEHRAEEAAQKTAGKVKGRRKK